MNSHMEQLVKNHVQHASPPAVPVDKKSPENAMVIVLAVLVALHDRSETRLSVRMLAVIDVTVVQELHTRFRIDAILAEQESDDVVRTVFVARVTNIWGEHAQVCVPELMGQHPPPGCPSIPRRFQWF
jgi:hypothetical protein